MSQRDALQAIDAVIHSGMAAVGMAGSGEYQVGTGAALPCRCYFDDAQQDFGGDVASVVGARRVLSIFLADVPSPQRGAAVTLDDETWTLSKQVAIDESIVKWVVTHG